ncbi:hypothetical protein [Amycolatopsis sp. MEPSY49]|uniref:hypothetical protein n=1 Tax=Amycolatopsis sp. MEPSY49 TaxID=3151600 RepID=UPI003EF10DF8
MTEATTHEQPFRRLRYFHGQLLTARDFQREQEYFREKLKLRMRCLLGYGVVCGLLVEPAPPADEKEKHEHQARVRITAGLGVDCDGNEVLVPGGCAIDLWDAVHEDERTGGTTVWVGVEYTERAVEPTRTVFNSACADTSDCDFGYTEESYCVRVTTKTPPEDERCETCCTPCEHKILWLARIDDVDFGKPVREEQIHLNVRRLFGRHVPTVITGINWRHGHTYTVDQAKELLGTQKNSGGLVVEFSDDVRVDSLRRGVVEIQVIEGGAGRNADTWYMGGQFEEPTEKDGEFTRRFRYRQTTRETLQDGDRVLVTIRAAFLLDRCCRPVDGTNVGGRVPFIGRAHADAETETGHGHDPKPEPDPTGCLVPPSGIGPWTSGTGAGGDVFESWFFVTEERS